MAQEAIASGAVTPGWSDRPRLTQELVLPLECYGACERRRPFLEMDRVVPMPIRMRDFLDWCEIHGITGWSRSHLWGIVEELDRLELIAIRAATPEPGMQYGTEQGGDCAHLYPQQEPADGRDD